MNNLRNKVQLIGNVGINPEVKTFGEGKTRVHFSLATNESYKNKNGEKIEETQWHNIVCWGKGAELAASLIKKGAEIAIEGKIVSRKYEDKDKNTRYITEIVMNEFLLLGKKVG